MYFHLELRGPHAGELSYVLGKHPDRLFEWEVQGSTVRVFFPIYRTDQARAVVLFWPDPLSASRRGAHRSGPAEELAGPRSYAVNALFCTALKVAFNSAITGNRHAPPDVLGRDHDLEVCLTPVCTYLSPERITSLFTPLGYTVNLHREDEKPELDFGLRHPRVYRIDLTGRGKVADVLRHIFVLAQVMDSERHEHLDQNDVERLQRFGSGWLDPHPDRMFIVSRYLVFRRLVDTYLQAPSVREQDGEGERHDDGYDAAGEPLPIRPTVQVQRYQQLVDALLNLPTPPTRVLQVGCGDGKLLAELVGRGSFEEVVGTDASSQQLERARRRVDRAVRFSQALRRHPTRLDLLVSALGYHDERLHGYDAVILCDLIEYLEEARLPFYIGPILERWRPRQVLLTAPNREWSGLMNDRDRGHGEQRAEWDRTEFRALCELLAEGRGYTVTVNGIGAEAAERGSPTHLAIFTRAGGP